MKRSMNYRLLLLFACLACASCSRSRVTANVPSSNDFRLFLIRDLTAYLNSDATGYLESTHGDQLVVVDYEILLNGPTQSGTAYPEFYVWLNATNAELSVPQPVLEGAATVAAIEKKRFEVVNFSPKAGFVSHPFTHLGKFPESLREKINAKAWSKR
jgi:hypothetical protein